MVRKSNGNGAVTVLGAGITGLTAAYFLERQGYSPIVLERDKQAGGLAKTISHNGYRFDLGGHRFLTRNAGLERFVKSLLKQRYLVVNRTSNIYLNKRYIKYPLQPWNAFRQVGPRKSLAFLFDYARQKCKSHDDHPVSLEDWVVRRFGRSLYEVFFKGYSEKVWGLDCTKIDSDWIAQRIQNLSLAGAVKSALSKRAGKNYATLTDRFLYPADGIGTITENLLNGISADNVRLQACVTRICHDHNRITSVEYAHHDDVNRIEPDHIISTMPLSVMARLLDPAPPVEIADAAARLRSRDLVLVTLMVNRPQLTRDSWVYFPEPDVPFGRIHEPKNWSESMAPEGKTAVVTEHFCFRGDSTWLASDKQLIQHTVDSLSQLGFMSADELIDAVVLRIPNAYPLFEIGYRDHCATVQQYLSRFANLNLAGRTGAFRYYNMDHAMLSGIAAAEQITDVKVDLAKHGAERVSYAHPLAGEQHEMRPHYSGVAS